jgi:ABC-type lipoprotein export system ATPase subunit
MISGVKKDEAINRAKELAVNLSLLIDEKKKSFQLSGGERQRAAFIRAITTEFEVLFGDEPTGNLDEENSNTLLQILKDNIRKNNRTAVIVSHNKDLALNFADILIVLRKRMTTPDTGFGDLPSSNIFYCREIAGIRKWFNHSGEDITDNLRQTIKELEKDFSLLNVNK